MVGRIGTGESAVGAAVRVMPVSSCSPTPLPLTRISFRPKSKVSPLTLAPATRQALSASPCSMVKVLPTSAADVFVTNVHLYAAVAPCWAGAAQCIKPESRYTISLKVGFPSMLMLVHSLLSETKLAYLLPIARNGLVSVCGLGFIVTESSFLLAATGVPAVLSTPT